MIVLLMVISTLLFLSLIKFRMVSKGQTSVASALLYVYLIHSNGVIFCSAALKKIFVLLAIVKTAWIEARANLPLGT